MPVIVTEMPNKVKLRFQTGFNDSGNPVYSTYTYSKIKEDAIPEDVHSVAEGLASLCDWSLDSIVLSEDKLLTGI